MPFGNPILGGGGALVRESIHSPDYVAGVSGWTIDRDGSAEFADLTVRGGIFIDPDVSGGTFDGGVFSEPALDLPEIVSPELDGDGAIVAGGSLASDNYVPDVSGWAIDGDGVAEFSDVTVRGSVGTGGALVSSNYSAGVSGWAIDGDGDAEFNSATVRGDLITGPDDARLTYVDTFIGSGPGGASDGVGWLGPDPGTVGTRAYVYLTQAYPSPTIPASFQSYLSAYASHGVELKVDSGEIGLVGDTSVYGDLFMPSQAEAGIYADADLLLSAFAGGIELETEGASITFREAGGRHETAYSATHEDYDANGVRSTIFSGASFVWYADDGGTSLLLIDRDDEYVDIGEAGTRVHDLSTYYASGINNHSTSYGFGRGFIDANGIVTLQGLISNSGSSKSAGQTLMTLPSALRPPRRHIFTTTHSNTTNNVARIDVLTNGIVTLPNNGMATGAWVSLSGITYSLYE